jgi:hypothetical protein
MLHELRKAHPFSRLPSKSVGLAGLLSTQPEGADFMMAFSALSINSAFAQLAASSSSLFWSLSLESISEYIQS